jgi:hypothetical protein
VADDDEAEDRRTRLRQGVVDALTEQQISPSSILRGFVLIATWDDLDDGGKWIDITESHGMVSWEGLGLVEYVRQTYIERGNRVDD